MGTELLYTVGDDGIATITLNRPGKLNAISRDIRYGLRDAVEDLYDNQRVRVVIITGAGDHFCAGADVSHFERDWNTPEFRAGTRILTNVYNDLEALEKPVIAAINGTCAGGGLELALACDFRVAVAGARIGLPENRLGLIPGTGGCSRLVRLVGAGRAKELVLLGEMIPAAEAAAWGLVNRVYPAETFHSDVWTLAEKLLKRAPQAVGIAKRVIHTSISADLHSARTLESFGQSILVKTADHHEAIRAFQEKRRPRFQNR